MNKTKTEIRLNSGNKVQIYLSNAWVSLGIIKSGKITHKLDSSEVLPNDGVGFELPAKEKCSLQIVLYQCSKEALDLVSQYKGTVAKLLINNGLGLNSKYQEFFFPEVLILPNIELDLEAGKEQLIPVELPALPQDSVVTVNTYSGLPADSPAYEANPGSTKTGKNRYYLVLETQST